jgi:Cof subfamily protein (haloacid dehalogenase superfamily)
MAPNGPWRYLLVDVDGTLLDSQGSISPRGRAVLSQAVAAGLSLVLASGRTYVSLLRVTAGLDLPFYMIANGGAIGLTPDLAAPYLRVLAPALWPRIVESLLRERLSAAVFAHRLPEPPLVYVASARGDPHFEAYVSRNRAQVRVARDLPAAPIADVVEVAALGKGPAFEQASARVRACFAEETENHTMVLFIAARFGKITEFFRRGTTKWNAFLGLFPEAARHPETVIAIGDEANDRDMIACAGLGIAMGNATDELKGLARRVTADHDHDGLAEALEPILASLPRRTGTGGG